MPPCSVLAELTGQALDADMRRLTDDELVGVMRAAHRNASWQAAVELAAIDELASRRQVEVSGAGPPPAERAAAEIAVALTLPDGTAARLVDFAAGLAMLADVGEWLRRGEIDVRKAEIFVQELAPLPCLQASIIACRHLQAATEMTSSQLRAALRVRCWQLTLRPDGAASAMRVKRHEWSGGPSTPGTARSPAGNFPQPRRCWLMSISRRSRNRLRPQVRPAR
jgi:Domain of unknown function (DUF222)